MPFKISYINSINEFGVKTPETKQQVYQLAKSVMPSRNHVRPKYTIAATSCPDSISPSLTQLLCSGFHSYIGKSHCFDIVQGCAGGVSALILASKLAEEKDSSVLLVQSDAAQKATSVKQEYYKIFGNGAFACLLNNAEQGIQLLHSKSQQVAGLENIVRIALGHDADELINHAPLDLKKDPRYYLGLQLNNDKAMELLKFSKVFYNEFVEECGSPDVLILHQVNPKIIGFLKNYLSDFKGEFIDLSSSIGNCGTATTGIALHRSIEKLHSKKVMICSFGTGGIITAGLWQF